MRTGYLAQRRIRHSLAGVAYTPAWPASRTAKDSERRRVCAKTKFALSASLTTLSSRRISFSPKGQRTTLPAK